MRKPRAKAPRKPRRQTEQEQHQAVVDDLAKQPTETEAALEQIAHALRAQVNLTRNAFFRLASVRAADLVKHEGKSWDDGATYINAEMAELDAQLKAVEPQ